MFTGIAEEIGVIEKIEIGSVGYVTIKAEKILSDIHIGDSIAVNGVCLTVTTFHHNSFTADVMPESIRKSNLGNLKKGGFVNLERAMSASGRFGGHIVSGHIDALGTITAIQKEQNAVWYTISCKEKALRHIVAEGSITIDGISLTVAHLLENEFQISMIPHTKEETALSKKAVGDTVNLETDIIAKYVERLLTVPAPEKIKSHIDMDFLTRCGF